MHPAFSVLFFTVTSGFGYGLLGCLLVAQLTGWHPFSGTELLAGVGVATLLFTLGLLSSTLHLANPKNAWRSFTRFRTSWLSREGVLAILGYPLFAAWTVTVWLQAPLLWQQVLGLLALALVISLIYSTAMIYASLKTIPQWHSPLVPLAFLLFALSSGLLCFGILSHWQAPGSIELTAIALLAGAVLKLVYFAQVGRPTISSINTATSFSQAQVTLFDSGHSSRNFSQREFIYQIGPQTTLLARRLALILGFILPAALLLAAPGSAAGWIAVGLAWLGLLIERWLFFVEARHVVRHYYAS